MRAVFDSNVIITAFAARGLCNAILESSVGKQELVLSEQILKEVCSKLNKKIGLPGHIVDEITGFLRTHATVVKPGKVDREACRDKKDLMVLGTAVAGKANYIVTGDEDLLVLERFRAIDIISPRTFWQVLKKI